MWRENAEQSYTTEAMDTAMLRVVWILLQESGLDIATGEWSGYCYRSGLDIATGEWSGYCYRRVVWILLQESGLDIATGEWSGYCYRSGLDIATGEWSGYCYRRVVWILLQESGLGTAHAPSARAYGTTVPWPWQRACKVASVSLWPGFTSANQLSVWNASLQLLIHDQFQCFEIHKGRWEIQIPSSPMICSITACQNMSCTCNIKRPSFSKLTVRGSKPSTAVICGLTN